MIVVVAIAFIANAESPVKVKSNDFWWKSTKHCAEKFVKSVKVEWDNEAALDLMKVVIDKAKETGKNFIEDAKKERSENIKIEWIRTPTKDNDQKS
jgi:hypothetical protein